MVIHCAMLKRFADQSMFMSAVTAERYDSLILTATYSKDLQCYMKPRPRRCQTSALPRSSTTDDVVEETVIKPG